MDSTRVTLRIDNIPEGTSEAAVEQHIRPLCDYAPVVQQHALGSPRIRSLARRNSQYLSATVDFQTSSPKDKVAATLAAALGACAPELGYRFDSSFQGITPLYECDDTVDICDIVAVPGLGAHALGSWKSPDSNDFWLRDWLAQDIPRIRVLVYGYDTRLLHSNSLSSIKDLAARFRDSLAAFRSSTGTEKRPVIYIGHSLGGLLMKEALVQAFKSSRSQPLQRPLYQKCLGMVFFGVPHAGVRYEELTAIVQERPNEKMVESIVVTNETEPTAFLSSLSDDFAWCFQGATQVMSWYERKTSLTIKMVNGKLRKGEPSRLLVTKQSATRTGLTSVPDENNYASEADHSGLVKFDWNGHSDYVSVKEKLRNWVEEARPILPSRADQSEDERPHPRSRRAVIMNQGGSTFNNQITMGERGTINQGDQQNTHYHYRNH